MAKAFIYPIYLLLRYGLRYRRAVIVDNLTKSDLELSLSSFLKDHYLHLADLITSALFTFFINKSSLLNKVFLDRPIAEIFKHVEGPTLIWTSHYNHWERAGISLAALTDRPVKLVYQKQNSLVQRWVNQTRSTTGAALVSQKALFKSLVKDKKNQTPSLYVMLCDQGPIYVEKSFWLTFLGRKTPFLSGPERIARRLDLPVVYAAIYGSSQLLHPSFKELTATDDIGELTRRYARELEKTIIKAPHLWLWTHRRWKRAHREEEVLESKWLLYDE